jgi:hypothetical protein
MRSEPATWERILLHMERSDGPHTQPRITQELRVSPKMICAGLSKLEHLGFVNTGELVREPLARRSVRQYVMTPKGRLFSQNLRLIRRDES